MMRLPLALTLALVISILGCGPQADVVIRNVSVFDSESGAFRADQTVSVQDGVVQSIGSPARGRMEIDGTGQFLIPGLIDAHVHVDHPDELNLYPAYGVTSVFVLRGFPNHLKWRSEISEGTRFGPHLFLTGDYLEGYPPYMEPMMSLRGVDDARAAVRRQKEAGYDFVKVYSRLSNEQREAIVDEAHQIGTCVIGHGGPNSSLEQLVEAGQDNIAHGQEINRWYFESAGDSIGVARTTAILAGSGTSVTPNLSWTGGLLAQGTNLDSLLALPVARALHPAILQPFRPANNRYIRNAEEWVPQVRARLEVEEAQVRALHQANVLLLAGTDASTSGVFPGDALHNELAMLVDAGLSPAEALATATSNAGAFLARCLGDEVKVGRIAPGYSADLVLLNSSPLDDITNTRDISGVVQAGAWHSREALETRLDALDAQYRPLRPAIIELEQALFRGRTARARVIFDSLRAEKPDEILFSQYTPFFVGFGYLYGENGFNEDPQRLQSALDLYRMYSETYPDYHSAWYQLALTYQALGQLDSARESLERALELHPDYPAALDRIETLR